MDESQPRATQDNSHYLRRSWAMLTAEKGWMRPVLVLAAACCVPVVGTMLGSLAVVGYALEWARLTAWGVDSVPKQRNVSIGGILASGWRGFAVEFVWMLVAGLVSRLLAAVLNLLLLGFLSDLLQLVFSLFVSLFALVAMLRAAVYQRFGAGFGVGQMREMASRDPNGLLRVFGVQMVGVGILAGTGIACAIAFSASVVPAVMSGQVPYLMDLFTYGELTSYEYSQLMVGILNVLLGAWPVLVVLRFALMIVAVIAELLSVTACGLWFRQFDVPNWGSPSDPLPGAREADSPNVMI